MNITGIRRQADFSKLFSARGCRSLPDLPALELSKYRLAASKEDLVSAKDLFGLGHYKAANNRAYYAIFHAMRAVLAIESVDFKKHSAVIAFFRQNYIKTGALDILLSDIITNISLIRNESDYSDFFIATKSESESIVADTEKFVKAIDAYLNY